MHKLSFDIAKEQLIHSDKKIIDIAADLGYSDKSHFNRAFHQWSGMAPSAYRAQMMQESK
ncbi:helix-turn-helix domain-containing protein [Thalassotalea psychrophila]|uniref:helix-turn-helix domain-containing protein n=1 Tax=Thalassotalea psychrophila TaxID=3065647 RepID=UPI0038669ECA